jgi:hypothetical protein
VVTPSVLAWPQRRPFDRRMLFGLAGVLAAHLFLRIRLDRAAGVLSYVYLERSYPGVPERLFSELPFYRLLLPLPELNGVWGTTGFLPVYLLERWTSPVASYLILSSIAIIAVWWCSWVAFRSPVFSFTLALCLAFSPFNYHVYSVSGSVVLYLTITFLAVTALYHFKLLAVDGLTLRPMVVSTIALVCLALSYEAWIVYGLHILIIAPFVYVCSRRFENAAAIKPLGFVVGQVGTVLAAYVLIRVRYPSTFRFGTEADLITNYRSVAPAIDDFVSNFVSLFYVTLSQLLPPGFGFSVTLLTSRGPMDAARVSALMGDYHQAYQFLVYPHYLYMWRYAAGAALALFVVGLWLAVRRALMRGDRIAFTVVIFATMVLISSPGHLLIKFRPYNAAPFLGYKVAVSVVALYALFALLVDVAATKYRDAARRRLAIVATAWAYVVVLGLTWPRVLSVLSAQTGMGRYPDPLSALRSLWK